MIQKSQTALPWGRITGVLIVAVGLLWVTVRNLKIQNGDAPVNHAENKKSKGYDCLKDTPLPEAESRPLVDAMRWGLWELITCRSPWDQERRGVILTTTDVSIY